METQGRKALESTTLRNDSPAANLSICADCFLFEIVIASLDSHCEGDYVACGNLSLDSHCEGDSVACGNLDINSHCEGNFVACGNLNLLSLPFLRCSPLGRRRVATEGEPLPARRVVRSTGGLLIVITHPF